MTKFFRYQASTTSAGNATGGIPADASALRQASARLRALMNEHVRFLARIRREGLHEVVLPSPSIPRSQRLQYDPPTCAAGESRPGPQVLPPHSQVIRSASGLGSFVGLLSLDGVLQEADQTTSSTPQLTPDDALGHPFWQATWWSWSPLVQQRLRAAVAQVAAGQAIRYDETALIRGNQLITVDLALAPLIKGGEVTALICSAIDVSSHSTAARQTAPATRPPSSGSTP